MSKVLINQYYNNIQKAIQYGKSRNETAVRNYTWILLNAYANKKNYEVIPEIPTMGTRGKKVYPDGILKNNWGLDLGYWESKDEKDVIDDEIDAKIKKGYPLTNILFEDTQTAVLYQYGQEVMRVPVNDAEKLDALLDRFIDFKSETVHKFEVALENFKADIPQIIEVLRNRIEEAGSVKPDYIEARDTFHELCKVEINPEITLADIREMMIQHILTSDIFNKIFDDPDFHRHNSIARELEKLIDILFSYSDRRNLLGAIEHYYDAINATAASITDHREKQKFLKVLYENFYKVYNPKAADRLGVVYTPNEIVRFMVQGTDYLLEKHFGKTLADEGVEILDPAVGTGTFICDIIEHLPKQHLIKKYKNELHANEVAILPYYIANLNIEYTFKQKMGYYEEYPNLCFVDTLDNTGGLSYKGQQHTLFGLSSENAERISRQNNKKISVIIGNPPYNAKQPNYNYQNSNKGYLVVDKRIKDTYIKKGTAQNQIVVYDMYVRFLRWASDRIKDDGILCLITNNSYLNGRAFDGFRNCISDEFQAAYFVDLGGNIRELSGRDGIWMNEEHTIFGVAAAVGISICFLVKKKEVEHALCEINYIQPCEMRATRIEKIEWLKNHNFQKIPFLVIKPDEKHNWINQTDNDFDELLPLIDKEVKSGQGQKAVFKIFSRGIASQRDEWVYDSSKSDLENKIKYFADIYQNTLKDKNFGDKFKIKWDRELSKYLERGIEKSFNNESIVESLYRPFYKQYFYYDKHFNGMTYQWPEIYHQSAQNLYIAFNALGASKPFHLIAANQIVDLHLTGDTQCIPLFCINQENEKRANITDWALEQFRARYEGDAEPVTRTPHPVNRITKTDIFHYVYAVLHNPAYRKKYELNLKREFPRIPFNEDFWKWAEWGKQLMDLHINFETMEPWPLEIIEKQQERSIRDIQPELLSEAAEIDPMIAYRPKIKVKLKVIKGSGGQGEEVKGGKGEEVKGGKGEDVNWIIELDELTKLTGIPAIAWEYKLGNRSALEWILDQYKEKKPSDPTIAEKFNTYRFADYKEKVIDLLKRVCTVSVRTMEIVREMKDIISLKL